MEFNKIISVAGKPGLFHAISQTKSGFIVESLVDKKRFPIPSTNNVSLLENIAIYTYEEEVPLLTVFKNDFEQVKLSDFLLLIIYVFFVLGLRPNRSFF